MIALLLALALGAGACGGGGKKETTTTQRPTTTAAPLPAAPLTGVPASDRSVLQRPAIAVKIGNNPEARPQAGLDVADIVYEEEVEGRITRFLAVFHSAVPPRIGPVRSVRLMDPLIARPLKGIFVYSGGANVPERITRLQQSGLQYYDETGLVGIGARVLDPTHGNHVRPNILFTDPKRLWEAAKSNQPPPPMFTYLAGGAAFAGSPVSEVTVPVGTGGFKPTWRYDAKAKVWQRFYGITPFKALSGKQVAVTNLVIEFVQRTGEESLVTGSGEAVVLSQGKMVKGTWRHDSLDQPTKYFDAAGTEIRLAPGHTWVMLPLAGGSLVTK